VVEQPVAGPTLDRLRGRFGQAVAQEMGYDQTVADDLATHLNIKLDGSDVWMQFDWCGDEQTVSPVAADELEDVIVSYGRHIADDLKEHRGRDGERLPWD
jgi:hypothetical protein